MTTPDPHRLQKRMHHDVDEAATRPMPAIDAQQKLLDQFGGLQGMVYAAVPVVAFVVANAVVTLPIAVGGALAVALALTGWRLLRGERFTQAIGGLVGVAVAGGVAAWTGSAGGFFLIGIWASLAAALVMLRWAPRCSRWLCWSSSGRSATPPRDSPGPSRSGTPGEPDRCRCGTASAGHTNGTA
jgi:hypothetical protein